MHGGDADGGFWPWVWRRMESSHSGAGLHDLPSRDLGVLGSHCGPACQLGLATTPKLTGGHDVARGPERIDGFALRPAWTSQLESVVAGAGGGCCHGRGPAGGWLGGIVVLCCSGGMRSMRVQEVARQLIGEGR
jgi:hypothetical protein